MQFCHPSNDTRWTEIANPFGVNVVKRRPLVDICHIDTYGNQMLTGDTGPLQTGIDIFQNLSGLFLKRRPRFFSPCGVIGSCPEIKTNPPAVTLAE